MESQDCIFCSIPLINVLTISTLRHLACLALFFIFNNICVIIKLEQAYIYLASFLFLYPLQKNISGVNVCLPGTGFNRWARTQDWVWRIPNTWSKMQYDLYHRSRNRVRNFHADMTAAKSLLRRKNSRWVSVSEREDENSIGGQRELIKDALTNSRDYLECIKLCKLKQL